MNINRCYVEKRPGFDVEAKHTESELREVLGFCDVSVRIFNRYDIQNLSQDKLNDVISTVLSEPMSDICYEETLPDLDRRLLCIEPLPGQFDARADSCEQCIQMLLGGDRPIVKTAKVYAISGASDADFARIKTYIINPLEYREASFDKPDTLATATTNTVGKIEEIADFIKMEQSELENLLSDFEMAMSFADLQMIQAHFKKEGRNPTITEMRVFDTYWSDHCRHTTFGTIIETGDIEDARAKAAYDLFISVNGDKPVTLMNIATAAMRHLHKTGGLPMLDVSDENNACTLRVKANFTHGEEDWLVYFKNETHNHPTEIEPYGGASTCIGGAIRDPLSGRAYVYQAMRISGAGDPRKPIEETLPGKLPQRKITQTAAKGFSAYGNQIGIATGYVREFYHEGYIAKRLETGAVVGAAPLEAVRRETPANGDAIILLGGRTGRDGIGGATGSSKSHGTTTVSECAAEVQKGNAPEERKLQRLFRNADVTRLIKRCNDFGAGGVCVAVGELADGVEINLDTVPTKYDGLNGTELATSESQERMAVVVAAQDVDALLKYAAHENVEAVEIARVTDCNRLVMFWRGQKIVDIDRAFLDTNGAERTIALSIPKPLETIQAPCNNSFEDKLRSLCKDLNFCSQKWLVERFDASIGAASVFVPFGGKYALTETQVMAALLPAKGAKTASVMSHGFDPYFTESDPFAGSAYAVITSVAKLIASGVLLDTIHLSLQEYFPRLHDDPTRWKMPLLAMLGAFSAQMRLKIAAIGGKDSMSGSFGELDVPPTLISFAFGVGDAKGLISPEFKAADNYVYLLETPMTEEDLPDYAALSSVWERYADLCSEGKVLSAWASETGGVYGGIIKMCLGNMIGFSGEDSHDLFERKWGSIIFESAEQLDGFRLLGHTQSAPVINDVPLEELCTEWKKPLERVFSTKVEEPSNVPVIADTRKSPLVRKASIVGPKAIVPVFPGTNCEYDTAMAIERAGGICETVLVRNLTPQMLQDSIDMLEKTIKSAQMLVLPGGFSGGDEPDGSAKFIVSLFRNPRLMYAVHDLTQNRDGLILGICNGFQALIKLGLLPFGKISKMTADCPTLTHNSINRHQAMYVQTRIASVNSPWLSKCEVGEVFVQPISHGEGRFVANAEILETLKTNGQIAFQYLENPNGSDWNIEGICSLDGRILGKMAHTERFGEDVAINIYGNKHMPLFESGIDYFK
ncbi:MAG: phosphoribosylformylglycinamidine synthase [Oscillospiraceae bacterium]|nr:phosphoribosylformylglycinamidine synthase [Oscillospiraceae bacterium]